MENPLKEQVKNLSLNPGVYLMKDRHGDVIYVGKAKKLRERVLSYFVKNKQHSSKTLRLIQQLAEFDVIEVETELDALLLECRLIQQFRPIYNRQMNSFEKYNYIQINTDNDEISINILSVPTQKNCFGPFSTNRKLVELKQILESLYELNPSDYWHQSFAKHHTFPLTHTTIKTELLGAFTFDNQLPQKRLEAKMILAAENHSFEKALKLREDWQLLTRFFAQNKKLVLANQASWQLLQMTTHSKMKFYLIYQGLVINSRTFTKQTVAKYTFDELANKMLPKKEPKNIQQFSKEQVDFINILYSYINHHKEALLIDLTVPYAEK
ncbi:excinuclease ABC subunit C [Enterococcus sp. AZ170]|uniref:GIY-YIG nuclease family protein n=1 Tax=Enterococcus sp. AZ170 TaxID=2774747 RepID=UPI003D2FF5E5